MTLPKILVVMSRHPLLPYTGGEVISPLEEDVLENGSLLGSIPSAPSITT